MGLAGIRGGRVDGVGGGSGVGRVDEGGVDGVGGVGRRASQSFPGYVRRGCGDAGRWFGVRVSRGGRRADRGARAATRSGRRGQVAGVPTVMAKTCMAFSLLATPSLMSGRVMLATVLPASSDSVAQYTLTFWLILPPEPFA